MAPQQRITLTNERYPKGDVCRDLTQNEATARLVGMMLTGARSIGYESRADGYYIVVYEHGAGPLAYFSVGDMAAFMGTQLFRASYILNALCLRHETGRHIADAKASIERYFPTDALECPDRPFTSRMEAIRYVLAILLAPEGPSLNDISTWEIDSEEELVDWLESQLPEVP